MSQSGNGHLSEPPGNGLLTLGDLSYHPISSRNTVADANNWPSQNGISSKGLILTLLSAKWFEVLSSRVPGLKHHFLSLTPPPAPAVVTPEERSMLRGRSMTVRYGFPR